MHRKGLRPLADGSGHSADRSTAPITAARWGGSELRNDRWYPLGPLTQLRFFATGAVEIQLSDERVSLRR